MMEMEVLSESLDRLEYEITSGGAPVSQPRKKKNEARQGSTEAGTSFTTSFGLKTVLSGLKKGSQG